MNPDNPPLQAFVEVYPSNMVPMFCCMLMVTEVWPNHTVRACITMDEQSVRQVIQSLQSTLPKDL